MKKGALATGALALGSSAMGTGAAQEDTPDDGTTGGDGDSVLLLHPDAVENASFTVASDELDWSPIGDGGDGATTPDEETPAVGEETPDGEGTTPDVGGGGAENYATYLVQYEFSPSHVAPVFVPDGVDLSQDDERQLGEIEEIVEQPGDGGALGDQGDDGPTDGQADGLVFVRVSLEDGGVDTGTPTEETPETPETPTEGTPGTPEDGGLGTPTEETPGTTTEEEDDGLLG